MNQLYKVLLLAIITIGISPQACNSACFECDTQNKKCTACSQGFQLTILGECVKAAIPHCNFYLNSTYCIRCSPTYFVLNNTCSKDWSGCYKNISKSKCSTCSPELTLVNGTCFGVFNCAKYISQSKCAQCDQGFTLRDDICVALSDNCLILSQQNGVCSVCQSGHSLIGYKCILDDYFNPNCEIYDGLGRCFICKDGYTLYQDNCYGGSQIQLIKSLNQRSSTKTVENATISNQNEIKQIIRPAIVSQPVLSQNNSAGIIKIINNSITQDKYCKIADGTVCVQCYSNFHLSFGICKVNNPLCRQIYPNGSCKSCYSGYFIQAENCQLAAANLTKQSQPNNKLANTFQTSNDPNCVSFSSGRCFQCNKGYFINSNGTCSPSQANCLRFNQSNGNCYLCIAPYVLINNNCLYPTSNCLLYTLNGDCYQCFQGYFLQQKACYPSDVTCASYDIIGRCTKCVETYYLVGGACVFPAFGFDPYCSKYTNSYCVSCIVGFYLQNYKCEKITAKCLSFDQVNNLCLACDSDLKPDGPSCL